MNKFLNAVNSIYYGFLPMSQVKVTLFFIVFFYSVFLCFRITDDMSMQRWVVVEHKQEGGAVALGGVKRSAPYTIQKTEVKFDITNPVEFLLLSNGVTYESFGTALLKLITAVFSLWLIWKFDVNDPFNPRYYKYVNTLLGLLIAIIFIDFFKNVYLSSWTTAHANILGEFKVSNDFKFIYFLAYLWVLRAFISFYQTAVKTRREAELTI